MSDLKPGRGSDQFPLRFPDGMREKLKDEARSSGRSLNAEIVSRLESSLESNHNPSQSITATEVLHEHIHNIVKEVADAMESRGQASWRKNKIRISVTPEEAVESGINAVQIAKAERSNADAVADHYQDEISELKKIIKQKDGLLMAVCLQIFLNRDKLPKEALFLADAILFQSGELDLLSLEGDEEKFVPEARFNALVRRYFDNPQKNKPNRA